MGEVGPALIPRKSNCKTNGMKPPIEFRPGKPRVTQKGEDCGSIPQQPMADTGPRQKVVAHRESAPTSFDRKAYQREYMRRYRVRKANK